MTVPSFDPCDSFNFLTSRISRLIGQIIELKRPNDELGFPSSCLEILGELWRQDAINQKDLGRALTKSKSSINKMILALESAQMISRKQDHKDKRNNIVTLTQKGRDLKVFFMLKSNEGEKRASRGISKEDMKKTKEVLKKMYDNLQLIYEENQALYMANTETIKA